jgi:hypothetical protein
VSGYSHSEDFGRAALFCYAWRPATERPLWFETGQSRRWAQPGHAFAGAKPSAFKQLHRILRDPQTTANRSVDEIAPRRIANIAARHQHPAFMLC